MSYTFLAFRRIALSKEWTKAAKKTGAAAVYIVNAHDDKELPFLPPGFTYCENYYMQ
jgi:hypothetical protein